MLINILRRTLPRLSASIHCVLFFLSPTCTESTDTKANTHEDKRYEGAAVDR